MEKRFSFIGKEIKIYPKAISQTWKKPRIGKIVDDETSPLGVSYFIKVDKMDGLVQLSDVMFLKLMNENLIMPYEK